MMVASNLRSVTLQAIFGVLGVIAGLYMAFGRTDWRLGEAMPGGAKRVAMGGGLAFLSVLMGIGGGTFGVPLMSLYNMAIHRAVATAAGFGVIIAVPSVIGFLLLNIEDEPPYTVGAVNLPAFAVIIAMTLITAPWGVKLAHAMDPKPLKRAFAVFITLVALNMLRKVLGMVAALPESGWQRLTSPEIAAWAGAALPMAAQVVRAQRRAVALRRHMVRRR